MEDVRKYALILRVVELLGQRKLKVTHRRINEVMYLFNAIDRTPYRFLVCSGKPRSNELIYDIDIAIEAKILGYHRETIIPGKNAKMVHKELGRFLEQKEPLLQYSVEALARRTYDETRAFIAAIHEVLEKPKPNSTLEWLERVEKVMGSGYVKLIEKEIREVRKLCH